MWTLPRLHSSLRVTTQWLLAHAAGNPMAGTGPVSVWASGDDAVPMVFSQATCLIPRAAYSLKCERTAAQLSEVAVGTMIGLIVALAGGVGSVMVPPAVGAAGVTVAADACGTANSAA